MKGLAQSCALFINLFYYYRLIFCFIFTCFSLLSFCVRCCYAMVSDDDWWMARADYISYVSDVNECNDVNACDQRCVNTRGSYHCECDAGYERSNTVPLCIGMYQGYEQSNTPCHSASVRTGATNSQTHRATLHRYVPGLRTVKHTVPLCVGTYRGYEQSNTQCHSTSVWLVPLPGTTNFTSHVFFVFYCTCLTSWHNHLLWMLWIITSQISVQYKNKLNKYIRHVKYIIITCIAN